MHLKSVSLHTGVRSVKLGRVKLTAPKSGDNLIISIMGPVPEYNVTTEKPDSKGSTLPAPKSDKVDVAVDKTLTPEGILPGWKVMRPLRMRELNGKGRGGASTTSKPIAETNVSTKGRGIDNDNQSNNDLKVTETNETNGSGDGQCGIGEVEALQTVSSGDNLLESDAIGSAPRGLASDHGGRCHTEDDVTTISGETEYKVYKRRWFGLLQLVLLNDGTA